MLAPKVGLEPLQHQALLQAFGAGPSPLTIGELAERLDIVPALASRTVKELEQKELVVRRRHPNDRRVIAVIVTDDGRDLLQRIDAAVHLHVEYFQSQLTDEQRKAALIILTFYVGLGSPARLAAIMSPAEAG